MPTQTAPPFAPARPRRAAGTAGLSPARRQPSLIEISQPWGGRMWPCSAAEEQSFVADLHERNFAANSEFDRRDVTALVTALRSGLRAHDLLESARGLKPARLIAAHAALDDQRRVATDAWHAIVTEPDVRTLEQHGPTAAQLLPAVIGHIARDVRRSGNAHRVIVEAAARVARATSEVHELEAHLASGALPASKAREIGALLYNGHDTGAWNMETFLPDRVGSLVPLRVAALLGEHRLLAARG